MGLLAPLCFASNGNKLFGFGFAGYYSDPSSSSGYNYLVTSNANPAADLSNLSWQLVSTAYRNSGSIYYLIGFDVGDLQCTVDDQGVFTVIARTAVSTLGLPRDQYQCTNGTWLNVDTRNTTSTGYSWDIVASSQLAIFKDPASGNNTVVHVSGDWITQDFYIATMNQDPPLFLSQGNPLTWDTKYGVQWLLSMTLDGHIYSLGSFASNATVLTTLAMTSPAVTMPSTTYVSYDSSIFQQKCSIELSTWMSSFGNKLLIWAHCGTTTKYYTAILFDPSVNGGTFSALNQIPDNALPQSAAPATVVLNGNGQGSFLFLFNTSGFAWSAPLTDGSGTVIASLLPSKSQRIQIPDAFGYNPNPYAVPSPTTQAPYTHIPTSNDPPNSSNSKSSSSTGTIVGIVVALIVVAILAGFVFWGKKKRARQAIIDKAVADATDVKPVSNNNNAGFVPGPNLIAAVHEVKERQGIETKQDSTPKGFSTVYSDSRPLPSLPTLSSSEEVSSQQVQPVLHQPPAQQYQPRTLYTPRTLTTPTTASTTASPIPPLISPVVSYPQAQPRIYQPPQQYQPRTVPMPVTVPSHPPPVVQSVQAELQQQFQFSTHPRPKFVTTVRSLDPDKDSPSSSSSATLPTSGPWQPKPFVPPRSSTGVSPLNSTGSPSSSNSLASHQRYSINKVGEGESSSHNGGGGSTGYSSPTYTTSSSVSSPSIPYNTRPK
ncbi:hypothetical protein BGZ83_010730 [Gryganskiella cystojenkinii]|nr:hypothetical protein BGZ83_010730 [Gryganskiella cystojenkinii]